MDGTSRPEGKVFIPSHQPHSIREIDLQRKKPTMYQLFSKRRVSLLLIPLPPPRFRVVPTLQKGDFFFPPFDKGRWEG